ncbi:MAG: hypothetical protein OEM48_00985 [Gammaproteobacteria bacterium]|nr:hypothetical protein [Gammaproteobacteria bacterium]MDH3405489.1 hypothetical protein [Gammaproteobacteria bacterium]MDH3562090.1 hypothetical protein [Gammaproteobacteria bacterium]MDH5488163.1 hypothetical protein [Gammaproteobacteria bacterium]
MARISRQEHREDSADEAINRVLAAEQEALKGVAHAEQQAVELIAKARLHARHIEERADARSSKLRVRCRTWVAREVAARRSKAEQVLACPVEADDRQQKLRVAIARLAVELTGGDE